MGNKCSYGFVLRDDQGDFIAGGGGRLLGALDPRTAEALAFREALSWIKNKGCQNVYMELDCLSVVEAIRCKASDEPYFGTVIEDFLDLLKDLRSSFVYFVRRSANSVAHAIDRASSSMFGHEEWSCVPSFLIDVIAKDFEFLMKNFSLVFERN
ncbi:uncharacterized protein LOC141691281 [Apium graveolens]|uniref:uncharacterized protein LOC141691281 n=1 Tax=Apium graveolens TaxID=4045 RepID=UPI003D7B04EC